MKYSTIALFTGVAGTLVLAGPAPAQEDEIDPNRAANLVILDETGVRNLGIETVEVLETDFEETVFALGRIEEIPTRHGVVSSRIAGRVIELNAQVGDTVTAGQIVATIESRQVGDPPPRIPLEAPLGGLVTESHVSIGEPIEPAKEIIDIIDLSEAYAIARVPEDQAGRLVPGTRAHIRVAALTDESFEGELLRFGVAADRESGTLDAVFLIPNPSGRLRPHMRAEFSIVLGKRANVMAVPREALQGDVANRVVYVKDFDLPNAFVKAPVLVGARNDRYVEIINGLFPGDEVVTKGSYPLGFAGGGSVSLKEALDSAHGHEHAEDGSELTPEKRAEMAAAESGHGHAEGHGGFPFLTTFFAGTSALLFILLVLSTWMRKGNGSATS